jgi:hypothetical protein
MAQHSGRSGKATSITLTYEAHAVLLSMIDSSKKLGQFVSSLILQERARQEERARLQGHRPRQVEHAHE